MVKHLLLFILLALESYSFAVLRMYDNAPPQEQQGFFNYNQTIEPQNPNAVGSFQTQYINFRKNDTSSSKHIPYIPLEQQTQEAQLPEFRHGNGRATPQEIAQIKQLYRHVNIHNKIEAVNFVNIHFMYVLPTSVEDFSEKLKGNNVLSQAAITSFETQYKKNVSNTDTIVLNNKNFGITGSYGKRIGYDLLTEWQVFFYQAKYVSDSQFKGAENIFKVSYMDGTNEVVMGYKNVEYIQRTFGVHYNLHKTFPDFFKESNNVTFRKLVPYFMIGAGVSSRFELLRMSNGVLGNGGQTGGATTKQDYFRIMPSFSVGIGTTYSFTQKVAMDFRFSTIQVIPNFNLKNFVFQVGGRFYI